MQFVRFADAEIDQTSIPAQLCQQRKQLRHVALGVNIKCLNAAGVFRH